MATFVDKSDFIRIASQLEDWDPKMIVPKQTEVIAYKMHMYINDACNANIHITMHHFDSKINRLVFFKL